MIVSHSTKSKNILLPCTKYVPALRSYEKCRPALKRVCIFYCSELPLHPQLCIHAALFAGPAVDTQVKVHIGGNFGAEA